MFTSEAQLCNAALSALGLDADIQALDETSAEARACNLFYENTRDEVLRDFPWPFARQVTATALSVVVGQPNEFTYQYREPADSLRPLRLLPYGTVTGVTTGRLETAATRVKFVRREDSSGGLIWTDFYNPVLEYTALVEDVARFPPDFSAALALLLASYIAPRLTGGDPHKLGERSLIKYQWRIQTARANAANEDAQELPTDSELILARES
jgi:hypothetical protein